MSLLIIFYMIVIFLSFRELLSYDVFSTKEKQKSKIRKIRKILSLILLYIPN